MVCWVSEPSIGSPYEVIAQIYDAFGVKKGNEIKVNTENYYYPYSTIAALSDGEFLVCWWHKKRDGSDFGIFGQIFDRSGNRIGHEFQMYALTGPSRGELATASVSTGEFVVCWVSYNQLNHNAGWDIYGKRFLGELLVHQSGLHVLEHFAELRQQLARRVAGAALGKIARPIDHLA